MRVVPAALAASMAAALAFAAAGPATATATSGAPRVISDVTLPAPALADFERHLVKDDHGVKLGGVGSGLYPAGRSGEYWMVTDRGPNGQPEIDGEKRRTFPAPGFAPAIVRVSVQHGKAKIAQTITLKTSAGKPITGLSNQKDHDEKPYGWDGKATLPYDPNGLDTEDIIRTSKGEFWLVDEYSPSLVRVAANGRILARYVPKGLHLTHTGYPVHETLPGIFLKRQQNRGFEGLGISGDRLYVALQSPLENPDKDISKTSKVTRILAVDLRTGKPVGEYAYVFEDVTKFDPKVAGDQSAMKISSVVGLGGGKLLVEERTDNVARLYTADLRGATNLLWGKYDLARTKPSLETALPSKVKPLAKKLTVDLAAISKVPGKLEGVAVLDRTTIAVANDNDFGLGEFDENGKLIDTGVPSRLLVIKLPRALG
ncbi:esterase-like activity of phytase family protein [Streptosporangium sp. 'caverna']|uniref:esterase-like activity of phytase family protein n=1 Tax=Streptosporangium sp. 'caverna' TaxID=2202249 RepID=UPI000D7EB45D|nr:esterase-like activity of phytase family protein [Streptosporangium sp. 'caverna']AWS44350.1 Tat pathway signal protein [Streptosporangium sp. 'caverna']